MREPLNRKQFTFYESFKKAASRLKEKTDRADFYDAISDYALYGTRPEIENFSDAVAVALELVIPVLDSSRKKAASGKVGGKRKQSESKVKANQKQEQIASEKEGEIEKEKEGEIENECYPPTPLPTSEKANAVSAVLADYLDRVNPMASQMSLDKLKGYAEEMGEAVCKRAFDIALDNKKASWSYIEAILQDRLRRGVKCLADWDALEEQVKARKEAEKNGRDQRDHQESENKAYHVGTDL